MYPRNEAAVTMCLPCYVPKVLQPRRSWADFKEVAAPPRALRTNVSIYLSSPSPAAVFLMEILSGTADGTPHTHQLRSSTDPQVMIWVFACSLLIFFIVLAIVACTYRVSRAKVLNRMLLEPRCPRSISRNHSTPCYWQSQPNLDQKLLFVRFLLRLY